MRGRGLTTKGAAEILGVSTDLVRELSDTGRLPPMIRTPGGHRRYRVEDVERLRAELRGETTDRPVSDGVSERIKELITELYKLVSPEDQKDLALVETLRA